MMKTLLLTLALGMSACLPSTNLHAQGTPTIERGSKIFIEPMEGFESYLSAAVLKKHVPLTIVDSRDKADFVVAGTSHIERAGWAKTIFVSPAPQAGASITIKNAKTGDLVYAYSVDKFNAARANQSTAEACAKHLKSFMEKKK